MKSHLSAVHTGLETPYTPAVPLLCPHPVCFTPNVNGSFLEEIKKMGEKEGATARWACLTGLSVAGRAPASFPSFTLDPSAVGRSDIHSGQITNSPSPEATFISPQNKDVILGFPNSFINRIRKLLNSSHLSNSLLIIYL